MHAQPLFPYRSANAAAAASERFADWIDAEAPKRTGPSGIGKEQYNWAAKNVYLLPYDWDAQVLLLKRELERAWSSLALEEARNAKLPPLQPIEDAAVYEQRMTQDATRLSSFLIDRGFMPDRPWYRAAIPAYRLPWAPRAQRSFFQHLLARDPLTMQPHFYHYVELARLKHDPDTDALRRRAPILNVWQDRSEGVATAMEELAMQAGSLDDRPRSRELVWIQLANRAARGLASLYVQANEMTEAEAGRFHARWTPRGFSDPASPLVAFEQHVYLRQPGYGPSYIIGKLQFEGLLSRMAHRAQEEGRSFDVAVATRRIVERGFLPFSLIEDELR